MSDAPAPIACVKRDLKSTSFLSSGGGIPPPLDFGPCRASSDRVPDSSGGRRRDRLDARMAFGRGFSEHDSQDRDADENQTEQDGRSPEQPVDPVAEDL